MVNNEFDILSRLEVERATDRRTDGQSQDNSELFPTNWESALKINFKKKEAPHETVQNIKISIALLVF